MDEPRRFLVIRLSAMGDVLLATPLVRWLKNRFPEADIDFLVKKPYEPLLRANQHLHRVLAFDTEERGGFWRVLKQIRGGGYDFVVDLQASPRSAVLRFFSGIPKKACYRPGRWKRFLLVHFRLDVYGKVRPVPLRYLDAVFSWGVEDDGLGLELEVREETNQSVSAILKERGIGKNEKIVALAPGAGRATKRWLVEGFAEVGSYWGRKGKRIVLLGGEGDREVCASVSGRMTSPPLDLSGMLSLQQTAALLQKVELLLTNDSGVMHLGSALGRRVVAIFGPTTHHLGFTPFRIPSVVVERFLSCRPCSYHGTNVCPEGHFKCMKEIRSSDVIRAAERLLAEG